MTQSSGLVNTVWQLPGKAREKKKSINISFNNSRIQSSKYIGIKGKHLYLGSRMKLNISAAHLTLLVSSIAFALSTCCWSTTF